MKNEQKSKKLSRGWGSHQVRMAGFAIIMIGVGVGLFMHNRGMLDDGLFHCIFSWQSLLIVLGVWSLALKQWTQGLVLIGIGGFFLFPRIVISDFWPLLFVLIGVRLIIGMCTKRSLSKKFDKHCSEVTSNETEDGFVHSTVRMGGMKHIVLDPVFKGGRLHTRFGGTVLDLRNTSIVEGETIVELDCRFGGVELLVPHNWTIVSELDAAFAGVDDKRFRNHIELDTTRKLILRGRVSFGAVEIRN